MVISLHACDAAVCVSVQSEQFVHSTHRLVTYAFSSARRGVMFDLYQATCVCGECEPCVIVQFDNWEQTEMSNLFRPHGMAIWDLHVGIPCPELCHRCMSFAF